MDRVNIIFDSQVLNSVQLCAQRTDLYFNKDLRTPEMPKPIEEGDLLHKMYEFYNVRIKEGGYDLIYDNKRWKDLVDEAVAHGERHSLTLGISPQESSEVIFQFVKHTEFTRMEGVQILEVEKPFIVEIYKDDELGIFYTGKIDRLTNTPNYGVCPRDYKKAARTEMPLALSNQFTGYAFAMKSNVVIVDKVGFQKTLEPEKRFRAYPLLYNEETKEKWRQNTIWWGKQYAYYIETNTWPENRTSCDKYSGCSFIPICDAATVEGRKAVIAGQFIIGDKWDPTEVLLEKKKEVTA